MSFKPPAGISGWAFALPTDRIYDFQDYPKIAALASKCVGKWGAAAYCVDVVSWRFWRQGAVGQAGVLEVGCVWCGCRILEAVRN